MENMEIWNKNRVIDERYLKRAKVNGMDITSFSLMSVVEMATKQFGPIGKGWGYEIIEEKIDKGDVIQMGITHENGDRIPEIWEELHTLIISLWYMIDGEKIIMPNQAGHTPKLSKTKYGVSLDKEYYKKSLADAIKKSLSMLGFGADIFLGLLDDQHYALMQQEEQRLRIMSEKSDRIQELTEKTSRYCQAYRSNTMAHSLGAQYEGHCADVHRFARRYEIDPAPYIKKLEMACSARVEELKQQKQG